MAEKTYKKKNPQDLDIVPRLPHLEILVYLFAVENEEWKGTTVLVPGVLHVLRIVFPHIDEIEYYAEQAWEGLHRMGKEPTVSIHAWIYSQNWNLPTFTEFRRMMDEQDDPWYIADVFFTPPAFMGEVHSNQLLIDVFINNYFLSQFEAKTNSREHVEVPLEQA